MQEYFVYFKFFKPQYWSKRSAEDRRRICVVMPTKEKTVRLLQQSDGAPRFGKHGLQLCLVQGVSESRQRARQRVFSR